MALVTVTDAKTHLVIEDSRDDQLLLQLIQAAVSHVANETGRVLELAAQVEYFDGFPSTYIELEQLPLNGSDVTSITYLDSAGDSQTLSSSIYRVDQRFAKTRIYLAYGASWPVTRGGAATVTVTYLSLIHI